MLRLYDLRSLTPPTPSFDVHKAMTRMHHNPDSIPGRTRQNVSTASGVSWTVARPSHLAFSSFAQFTNSPSNDSARTLIVGFMRFWKISHSRVPIELFSRLEKRARAASFIFENLCLLSRPSHHVVIYRALHPTRTTINIRHLPPKLVLDIIPSRKVNMQLWSRRLVIIAPVIG
ncbi:hypothetical protein NC651_017505 [Populus alba x Populus x berolinensis]|nr:hypothetical protein NC651_017505 [Populus alba x Populus x berolinensis]